jgi:hypothetical protein
MAFVEAGIREFSRNLPKALSPKTHAIIDYGIAGAFFLGAGLLWGTSKRAAIASLACGAAETAAILLTDYPGGVAKVLSFETHGRIDATMSGTVAMLPAVLGFGGRKRGLFFRLQALSIGANASMTDFKTATPSFHRRAA